MLLNVDTGALFAVTGSGTLILEKLQAGATEPEIISTLCSRWPVPCAGVERDVANFIGQLMERGLCTLSANA